MQYTRTHLSASTHAQTDTPKTWDPRHSSPVFELCECSFRTKATWNLNEKIMREHLTRTHALAESPTLNEEHSQAALPKDECDSVCPWIYQATSNGYMVHRLLPHVYKWLIFVWEKIGVAGFCLVNEFFKLEYRLYSNIYCFILYRIDFIRIKLWIWRWILVLCKKDTRYHIWLFSKFLMRDEQKKVRIDFYPKQNVSIISLLTECEERKKKRNFSVAAAEDDGSGSRCGKGRKQINIPVCPDRQRTSLGSALVTH